MSYSEESDDTIGLPDGGLPESSVEHEDGNTKVCCNCGKDLRGHRRFKDSIGYWCKDCHRVDLKRNTVAEARCPGCGRMRPIDKLFQMPDGRQICSKCRQEVLAEAEKHAVAAMIEKEKETSEKRKVYILVGIFVLLLLMIAYHLLAPYFRR